MSYFHGPVSGVKSACSVAFARSFVVSLVLAALVFTTPVLLAQAPPPPPGGGGACSSEVFVSDTIPADGLTNFATVMDAYAAVCAGGTVHVAAGTYVESIDISDANAKDGVTIDGAGATTIIDGGVLTTNSVAISGMTFSNMTILHSDGTAGEGLFRMDNSGSISDLTLDGVVLDGQGIAGVHGILGQGLIGTVTVTGSTLERIANWAVFDSDSGGGIGDDGLTGFVFTNNVVRNNDGAIALRGADLASAVPTTSVVVTGNGFSNMNTNLYAGPCAWPDNQCGWAGIEVTRVAGTVTVTDNFFTNLQLGSFGEGEGLQAWMITDLVVTRNMFVNCDSGIEIANQDTHPVNASIHHNRFGDMATRAIGAWEAGSFLATPSTTAGIDASCNLWGNENGPLVVGQNDDTSNGQTYGDELVGTMIFVPWLLDDTTAICDSCNIIICNGGLDCDGNGIHDSDEIADPSLDCNSNHVLDSCELASGTLLDCNENGIPDSCEVLIGSDGTGVTNGADNLADAVPIGSGQHGVDTNFATTDGLELDEAVCDLGMFGDNQIYDDVWYSFTPGTTGEVGVSTCNLVSFDSRIAVYVGANGDPANAIACNDDSKTDCLNFSSYLTFQAVEGQLYTIRIGGWEPTVHGSGYMNLFWLSNQNNHGHLDINIDCNQNSIPDECDLNESGPTVDCNNNDVLDVCEIINGLVEDCDEDGLIDTCEIDTDSDGVIDDCDDDDDNDGVDDGADTDSLDPNVCADADGDGCDDCAIGTDDFGPLADNTPNNDGVDFDNDGFCDSGDDDDDNDGRLDDDDDDDNNPNVCSDTDKDGCDDCSGGSYDPANDGADFDEDGLCDAGDDDDDNDGSLDGDDDNDNNPNVCSDTDKDGCDDCSGGSYDPANDGTDTDSDGECDLTDTDIDGDGTDNECDIDHTSAASPLDCNADGVVDSCQLVDNDCNRDGIPDDCQTDCNRNDVPDDCDIDAGTSGDCNNNAVPDDCEDCDEFVSVGYAPADGVDHFDTITEAYAAICAGGSILVNEGTYTQSIDISDANAKDGISIIGVVETDPNTGAASGALTTIDGGILTTNSVAINGLILMNLNILHTDGTAGEGLFKMDNAGSISDLQLLNVHFDGQGIPGVHGILGQGLTGQVFVQFCTFENISGWSVFDSDSGGGIGDDGLTGFVFTNNLVRNNDGAIALRGAPLDAAIPTTGVLVGQNEFLNMNTNLYAGPCAWPNNQCGWAGIEVTRVAGLVNVVNNTFDNLQLGSFGEGEGLQAWMIDQLVVQGNTFNNCDSGIEIAFHDTHPVNAAINTNSFSNLATRAIGVWDAQNSEGTGGGFLNNPSTTAGISATFNYWGNENGPLVSGQNDHTGNGETYGGELVGTMAYWPWQIDPTGAGGIGGDCDSNGIYDYEDILAGAADCNGDQDLDSCEITADPTLDCDDDGALDACELIAGTGFDCNNNDILDNCDIAAATSKDCDEDGVPDECQIADGADDCDGDGEMDSCELLVGTGFDCNANGTLDHCDIDAAVSIDCNNDAIPDECQADCNGNSIPDDCDLSAGTSPDCNDNGIPDECDFSSGTFADCNNNRLLDVCEIASGASDCNSNGIPDECDLAESGPTVDCNNNDFLDSCEIANGFAEDCDEDGLIDTCEIDTDSDGIIDDCDDDDDNDGVDDGADIDSLDPNVCEDADGDGCDDCAIGTDDFGPLADNTPNNDGVDFDNDGLCDAGDDDDDNDGSLDVDDDDDNNPNVCSDDDSDGCDDCSNGSYDLANDGADFDEDGLCDAGDDDDDNDGSLDVDDDDDNNPNVCSDDDSDGCDDCSNGSYDLANDGTDTDSDGLCDIGDPDADGDGISDDCDTDYTSGTDCNGNGEIDSCEIASGSSIDSDNDGILDECEDFIRGDGNEDGQVDISDAIFVLQGLFGSGTLSDCEDAADVNDDGSLDVGDGISLLGYIFLAESSPAAPFPACGIDPTDQDSLGCDSYDNCP